MTMQARRLSSVPPKQSEPAHALHSLEMEMCALGAMLMLDRDAVTIGMRRLHERHFTGSWHPLIFRAIRAVENRRIGGESGVHRIDVVLVADEIRYAGQLEEVGGAAYLTALIEACPSSVNIDRYINEVIKWSKLRYQREVSEEWARRIVAPDADPDRLAFAVSIALGEIGLHGHADVAAIFDREK